MMSTLTIKHCDHCKKEIPEAQWEQIWIVQLLVTNASSYQRFGHSLQQHSKTVANRQEWCRPCVDQFNLLNYEWKPPMEAPKPAPTFEEQLREIIREEIEDNHS